MPGKFRTTPAANHATGLFMFKKRGRGPFFRLCSGSRFGDLDEFLARLNDFLDD